MVWLALSNQKFILPSYSFPTLRQHVLSFKLQVATTTCAQQLGFHTCVLMIHVSVECNKWHRTTNFSPGLSLGNC